MDDTRGIVDPAAGFERFALDRYVPGPDLEWAVDRYWVVGWDLPAEEAFEQQVVPHPAVHLVFERGRAEIQAITPLDFVRRIEGRGQALGAKFRPAGFRPFLGAPISGIAAKRFRASAVFGNQVDEIARVLGHADDLNRYTDVVERFIRSLGAQPLPMTTTVNTIVAHIIIRDTLDGSKAMG